MLRQPIRQSAGLALCLQMAGTVVSMLLLASCQTTGSQGSSNWDVLRPQTVVLGEDVVLPRNPRALASDHGVQATLRTAMELDQSKRFAEARHMFSKVRRVQPSAGQGYQAVTSSMAVLALKEGNFETFKRLARQLDTALGTPVRVAPQHLEVITLYRVVVGKAPPVNAPVNIKVLKDKYFAVRSAKMRRN